MTNHQKQFTVVIYNKDTNKTGNLNTMAWTWSDAIYQAQEWCEVVNNLLNSNLKVSHCIVEG